MIAFSTYPSLPFETPADVPEDLYSSIAQRTDLPAAFSEAGWATESVVAGWESSVDDVAGPAWEVWRSGS